MHADFVAAGTGERVDLVHLGAGLEAANARLPPQNFVEQPHIQEHATFERHGLAVVSRAAGADGDGDAAFGACRNGFDEVCFGARHDNRVRRFAVQLGVEDRRIPEIVTALAANGGAVD
jgi:hypothetical protein